MPTEEPVYFHSLFPLTPLQSACKMLFCRNKIPVGLLRSLRAFLQPTLTLGEPFQKGQGLEAWELFGPGSQRSVFKLTCWRRSRCSWELLKFLPMSKRQKVSSWQMLTQSWYSPGSGMRSRKIRYASHTASWHTARQRHEEWKTATAWEDALLPTQAQS